jgi:hypothetical protein
MCAGNPDTLVEILAIGEQRRPGLHRPVDVDLLELQPAFVSWRRLPQASFQFRGASRLAPAEIREDCRGAPARDVHHQDGQLQ